MKKIFFFLMIAVAVVSCESAADFDEIKVTPKPDPNIRYEIELTLTPVNDSIMKKAYTIYKITGQDKSVVEIGEHLSFHKVMSPDTLRKEVTDFTSQSEEPVLGAKTKVGNEITSGRIISQRYEKKFVTRTNHSDREFKSYHEEEVFQIDGQRIAFEITEYSFTDKGISLYSQDSDNEWDYKHLVSTIDAKFFETTSQHQGVTVLKKKADKEDPKDEFKDCGIDQKDDEISYWEEYTLTGKVVKDRYSLSPIANITAPTDQLVYKNSSSISFSMLAPGVPKTSTREVMMGDAKVVYTSYQTVYTAKMTQNINVPFVANAEAWSFELTRHGKKLSASKTAKNLSVAQASTPWNQNKGSNITEGTTEYEVYNGIAKITSVLGDFSGNVEIRVAITPTEPDDLKRMWTSDETANSLVLNKEFATSGLKKENRNVSFTEFFNGPGNQKFYEDTFQPLSITAFNVSGKNVSDATSNDFTIRSNAEDLIVTLSNGKTLSFNAQSQWWSIFSYTENGITATATGNAKNLDFVNEGLSAPIQTVATEDGLDFDVYTYTLTVKCVLGSKQTQIAIYVVKGFDRTITVEGEYVSKLSSSIAFDATNAPHLVISAEIRKKADGIFLRRMTRIDAAPWITELASETTETTNWTSAALAADGRWYSTTIEDIKDHWAYNNLSSKVSAWREITKANISLKGITVEQMEARGTLRTLADGSVMLTYKDLGGKTITIREK